MNIKTVYEKLEIEIRKKNPRHTEGSQNIFLNE